MSDTAPSPATQRKRDPAYYREWRAKRAKARLAAKQQSQQPAAQPEVLPATQAQQGQITATAERQSGARDGFPSSIGSSAPAREPSGRFPARPSVVPPCTPEQYTDVCSRYIRGELVRDILAAHPGLTWANISTYADLPANRDHWREVERLRKACNAAEIEDSARVALRAARGEDWETDTECGKYPGKTFKRSAALLDSAAAKLDPERHGRQAGRQGDTTVNVGVKVVVAPSGTDDAL